MTKNDQLFLSRLNEHPELRERMEGLLDMVENETGNFTKANDAEQYAIDALRKMGNDILHSWAKKAAIKSSENFNEQNKTYSGDGKKSPMAYNLWVCEVMEPIFRNAGKRRRPFIMSAGITSRCYSIPLQRVMTDFGADHPFGQVCNKLQEHYGITLPTSSIRKTTLLHGQKMQELKKDAVLPSINKLGSEQQIGEIDGCMLPIVTIDNGEDDKRKQKTLNWQEARLALVHEKDSEKPKFDATFKSSVDEAGQALLNCAVAAGFGEKTHLHAVSDGAFWIMDQVTTKFATQASYLVDFFHVCEYIAVASKTCNPDNHRAWAKQQETLLKNNEFEKVIQHLAIHLEPAEIESGKAPVRACHRYLSNRKDQLDYKTAIEKGLPIGSGEIESAHRYVIQKRLKLPGAWWITDNVESMLRLRVVRANDDWQEYWRSSVVA